MIKVTDAELEILKILWEAKLSDLPLSTTAIIQRMENRDWSDNTVKTLLSRLAKKGALETTQEGGRNFYNPLIAQNDFVQTESRNFADKLLDGLTFPLLANFLSQSTLNPSEIEELKRILEEKNHE